MPNDSDFTGLTHWQGGWAYLSRRQFQVAAMMAFGFNDDKIIAEYLGTSEKSVQAAISQIRKKTGWRSRRKIARFFASKIFTNPDEQFCPM